MNQSDSSDESPGPAATAGPAGGAHRGPDVGLSAVTAGAPSYGSPRVLADDEPAGLPAGLDQRFEVVDLLGRGGMGVVYLARDRRLGREVALKILLSCSELAMALFDVEARALAQLEHDHIVRIYELGLQKGVPFLVMELMRGWPLSTRLAEGRPTLVEAVRISVDMLKALACAHQRGIVHRDIKPGNVFIEQSGRVKVADFGLARMLTGEPAADATAGVIVGTPAYMAPEQRAGSLVGPAADIYSVGVVLHEMLTGRRLVGAVAPGLAAAPAGAATLPSAINPLVPVALDEATCRALSPRPEDRPSAEAFIEELSRWLEEARRPVVRSGADGVPVHPYKFLEHYTPQDRAIFFGRDAEIAELLAQVDNPVLRVVLLFGPCGIGKSSLVHAGFVPSLDPGRFTSVTVVSGPHPAGAIRAALLAHTASEDGAAEALGARIASCGRRTGRTLVLVVDQLEEVFTHNPRGSVRIAEFFTLVESLVSDQALPLRMVLSFRTEFRGAFHPLEDRLGHLQRAMPVREIAEAGLVEVVEGPSRLPEFRFRYQDGFAPHLVGQIAAHTRGAGEATLPVLQIVCRQLYDRMRSSAADTIGWDLFESTLGGVGGVLQRFVESRLSSPDYGAGAPIARQILKTLTMKDGAERFSRARDEEEVLGFPDRALARRVLDRLVADHLVVREESNGMFRVRLASEVICPLIDAWSLETGDVDRAARLLARGMRQWEDGGQRPDDLLAGAALALVSRNLPALSGLGEREHRFVRGSLARRSRRRVATVGAALLMLSLLAAFTYATWFRPGRLVLASDPPGASVVNGETQLGTTPLELPLRPGAYALTLNSPRHDPTRVDVTIPAGGTVDYHPVLRYPYGNISINTDPSGCVCELRSEGTPATAPATLSRTTPFIEEVPAGRYMMKLARPGYVTAEVGPFVVGANRQLVPRTVRLEKDSGSLVIRSHFPGCRATVTTEAEPATPVWQGTLPASAPIELPAGRYRVRTVSDIGATGDLSVSVSRRETSTVMPWLDYVRPLWEFKTEGEVVSCAALADLDGDGAADAIAGTNSRRVHAVSGRTGGALWSFQAKAEVVATPNVADLDGDSVPDVVIGSQDRHVYALSGKTGQVVWDVETGGFVNSSAALGDLDRDGVADAVVGSNDRHVWAISGKTGKLIWKTPLAGAVISSPALADLDGDRIPDAVVGCFDGTLSALAGATGKLLWSFKTTAPIQASPALADLDRDGVMDAVVGSFDGYLHCVSGKDGRELWKWRTDSAARRPEDVEGSPALAELDGDGVPDLVVGTSDGRIVALSGKTRAELWVHRAGDRIDSTPALADFTGDGIPDVVFCCRADRTLRVLDGRDGRQRIAIPTEGLFEQSPAIGDVNGDGFPDIVQATRGGRMRAYSPVFVGARWAFQAGSVVEAVPVLADLDGDDAPDLIVGTQDGVLRAVNGRTAAEMWRCGTGGTIYSSPALSRIDPDDVPDAIFGSMDGTVRAVSGRTGKVLWKFAAKGAVAAPVSVAPLGPHGAPVAVFSSWDGNLYGVSAQSGRKFFEVKIGGRAFTAPVAADVNGDGKLDVIAAADGVGLMAYELAQGGLLWHYPIKMELRGSAITADLDRDGAMDLVIGGIDGILRAVSGRTGKDLWAQQLGEQIFFAPALGDLDGDGTVDVVAGTRGGRVVALAGKDGRIQWSTTLSGEAMHPTLVHADGDALPDVMVTMTESGVHFLAGRDGRRLAGVPIMGVSMMAAAVPVDLSGSWKGRAVTWRDGREDRPFPAPAAPRRSLSLVHVQLGTTVVVADLPWPPAPSKPGEVRTFTQGRSMTGR